MKEVIENICELVDEYGSDLCGMDTLLRIDEHPDVLSCKHCIFQDMLIDDYKVCPP